MALADLLPMVRALPRADRLRLVNLLMADLTGEDGIPPVEAAGPYPIWSPYDAFEAAAALLEALRQEKTAS